MVGEISAEESNFNSRKRERIKNKSKGRGGNNGSPREFKHQVKVPRWMDEPWLRTCMAQFGYTRGEAIQYARSFDEKR